MTIASTGQFPNLLRELFLRDGNRSEREVGLLPNVRFNKVDSTVTFVAALSSFDFKQLNLCEALDHVSALQIVSPRRLVILDDSLL